MALRLYGFLGRSRAERVAWALNELGLDYDFIRLDVKRGEHLEPKFLQLNPSGKVPALEHNDRVLIESMAIIEYLDQWLPTIRLVPKDKTALQLYRERVYFGLTEIETYLWIADQARLLDHYQWPPETDHCALSLLQKNLTTVESWLSTHDYILGSRFTAADILFYHLISWAQSYEVSLQQTTLDYLHRLEARNPFPESMKRQ